MRPETLALAALALVAPSCAQYFSSGWTPGQAVPTNTPASPLAAETRPLPPPSQAQSPFSLSYILSTGPVSQLFDRFGINITERLEVARTNSDIWDTRVPLVTDDNFNDLIVNEVFTDEEEKHRVWLLIM
jgi:hypothetical protein